MNQAKITAKDTKTRKIYEHCRKENEADNERIKRENFNLKETKEQPATTGIINLFKMARMRVD